MTIEMVYSEKFKSRMVARMVGPHGVSASTLAGDAGIGQPTLSRWLREARTVPDMAKKSRRTKEKARPQRPQDWSPAEKLRVVVESRGLTDEELGAFLRKEGLHQAQVEEWSATAHSSLLTRKGAKKASAESKRIRELERELRRKEKALAEAAAPRDGCHPSVLGLATKWNVNSRSSRWRKPRSTQTDCSPAAGPPIAARSTQNADRRVPGQGTTLAALVPMGRLLRRHAPSTYYLVTTRCHQARFLLRPEPAINEAVLEWLTRAQQAYPGVQLFGLCVMSNHLHLLVRDTQGELAAWASYLLGNLARSINAIRKRWGTVFARRYSAEPVLDDAALLDRLVYVVTNPVNAGLCNQSRHWPGLLLWTPAGEPELREVSWVGRKAFRSARYRARQRGQAPPSAEEFRVRGTLVIHPLVAEMDSGSEGRCGISDAIAARERELAADRRRSGRPAMTRREVLAQDWQAAPRHPKRSPRPACHTTERRLRKAFIEGFRDFMGAFCEASAQWRSGIRNATFPPWSYPPGGSLVRIPEPAPA